MKTIKVFGGTIDVTKSILIDVDISFQHIHTFYMAMDYNGDVFLFAEKPSLNARNAWSVKYPNNVVCFVDTITNATVSYRNLRVLSRNQLIKLLEE